MGNYIENNLVIILPKDRLFITLIKMHSYFEQGINVTRRLKVNRGSLINISNNSIIVS